MTYYDWENIVKNKNIIELKQMIRDDHLGNDATEFAVNELLERFEDGINLNQNSFDSQESKIELLIRNGHLSDENTQFLNDVIIKRFADNNKNEQDLLVKQKKKIKNYSYIFGILQLIGGLLGAFLILDLLQLLPQIRLKDGLVISIEIVLISLSILSGISLLTRNKRIWLSQINQYLQLIQIKTSVFTFSYFSGGAILTGFSFEPAARMVLVNPLGIFTKVEIYWLYEMTLNESFFYINILSLVVLYYLSKIKLLMKKTENAEMLTKAHMQ